MKNRSGLISWPLMREGLKQFWYVPVLVFIAYFLVGIFPLIMFGANSGQFAQTSLTNENLGFLSNIGGFSLVAACVATRMWHGQAPAFSIVSQPYSRTKIFSTNVLMGWLMVVVPMLLMGVIYMAISPVIKVVPEGAELLSGPVLQDIAMVPAYGILDVLKWMLESTALITFMYSLSVLAGAFSGTTLMTVILSMFNMYIIPALIGTGLIYADEYLPGFYDVGELPTRLIFTSNPVLGKMFLVLTDFNPIFGTVVRSLLFTLAGLVIIVFSCIVFNKAKLERSGDHIMSKRAEALVTAIVTFMGAILLGLIMGVGFDSTGAMVVGNILGAILTWFVLKVILVRTVRVFKKEHLLPLIVGAILAAIFVGAFVGDVFGFASRVPDKADVAGISYNTPVNDYGFSVYDSLEEYVDTDSVIYDEELASRVVDFHQYIVDAGLISNEGDSTIPVMLRYTLKNGRKFERRFFINPDDRAIELLKAVVDSPEYKAKYMLPDDFLARAKWVEISCDIQYADGQYSTYDYSVTLDDKESIKRIIDAYETDLMEREFDLADYIDGQYGYYSENNMDEYVEPKYYCWIDVFISYEAGGKGEQGDGIFEITLNSPESELAKTIIEMYEEGKNN